MKLLLDTHALLWGVADDDRLGRAARNLIVDPHNQVIFSIVSLWEIVVKARIGKLRADAEEVAAAAVQAGMTLLGISTSHLQTLRQLPAHHRDPFDHLLIAQSIAEGVAFVSDDRRVGRYGINLIRCGAL